MIPLATYLKGSNWMKNIKDQKFGKLLVVELHNQSLAKRPINRWKCICDCGQVTLVQQNHLIRGTTKSCGCLHKRIGKESPFYPAAISKSNNSRQKSVFAVTKDRHSIKFHSISVGLSACNVRSVLNSFCLSRYSGSQIKAFSRKTISAN